MKTILFSYPEIFPLATSVLKSMEAEKGRYEHRRFPDGEISLHLSNSSFKDTKVVITAFLHNPDEKIPGLLFLAKEIRRRGATSVGLVVPYLPYMRQDTEFKPGDVVSAPLFAELLSGYFDWMVTVDPHLHRISSLDEIYTIPATPLTADPLLAEWIQNHVSAPLLIGPDSESAQWVSAIAQEVGCPFLILEKKRLGDRKVEITLPSSLDCKDKQPILIDDMISTGHTLITTIELLKKAGVPKPVCLAVHGLFVEGAYEKLKKAGAKQIVTTNSIHHASNGIDLGTLVSNFIMKKRISSCVD